jgi:predicted phage terminase large subunit-like protein
LLRPDAFSSRDIVRLMAMKRPTFETLQQQNPGAVDQLRIRAEHFGVVTAATVPRDAPVVLSIDPGMRGGHDNSHAVIQAWMPLGDRYLLADVWREQARYSQFRDAVYSFIRKFRPSVILIEATGYGTAVMSDIRPQQGMRVEPITPVGEKVARLYSHRKTIRDGKVALLEGAPWAADFLDEVTRFPYAEFDDQVDAMTQFLTWIVQHPEVPPRSPRALMAAVSSAGIPLRPAADVHALQGRGVVALLRRRLW